ncbi:MAG: hypothetical protein J2P45_27590 [Candidatus Dormibacteraeota bacterium]|nr:hypothetical protein [Candidatus Dormibacteraeota bacterium]
MSLHNDAAIDLEHFELRLFPSDPPPSCDLQAEEHRLPYDLSAPPPSPALVRLIERFGLPERPLVANRQDDAGEDEYQVLRGGAWIRAAREAGLERIPVRAIEIPDLQAAFLALVLNQSEAADVAAQADALQFLLESGVDEEEVARASGLGRGRLRRLRSLLELHPVLRQALREGCLRSQVAFAASQLSTASQEQLASQYMEEGELRTADLKLVSAPASTGTAAPAHDVEPDPEVDPPHLEVVPPEHPALRAQRQARALLLTLEQAEVADEIRRRVAEVVEQLEAIAG